MCYQEIGASPTVKYGNARDVVDESFLSSHLWKYVRRFCLTNSTGDRGDIPFAQTVLSVGEGSIEPTTPSDGSADLPLKHATEDPDASGHVCRINGTTDFDKLVQPV